MADIIKMLEKGDKLNLQTQLAVIFEYIDDKIEDIGRDISKILGEGAKMVIPPAMDVKFFGNAPIQITRLSVEKGTINFNLSPNRIDIIIRDEANEKGKEIILQILEGVNKYLKVGIRHIGFVKTFFQKGAIDYSKYVNNIEGIDGLKLSVNTKKTIYKNIYTYIENIDTGVMNGPEGIIMNGVLITHDLNNINNGQHIEIPQDKINEFISVIIDSAEKEFKNNLIIK